MFIRSTRRRIPPEQRRRILERDHYSCRGCGRKNRRIPGQDWILEIDHIIPLDVGGSDADSNLQIYCVECHDKKHPWRKKFHFPRTYSQRTKQRQQVKRASRMLRGIEMPQKPKGVKQSDFLELEDVIPQSELRWND